MPGKTTAGTEPTTPTEPTPQAETVVADPFAQRTAVQPTVTTTTFQAAATVLPSDATTAVTVDKPDGKNDQPQAMSQADIDKIIAARLKQERAKYSDYDDLKAKVQAAEDAQKTDAQKAAERVTQLETENQRLATESKTQSVRSAVVAEAARIGLDPNAAYKLADLTQVAADNSNIAEIVQSVATQYPALMRMTAPALAAVNPARTAQETAQRTDIERRRDYFGSGGSQFWTGGGVRFPEESN